MTAPSSLFDFDDGSALIAADVDGLLRAAAMAGAQIRSVAAATAEGVLARLADLRPRSIVLVTGDAASARAARVVTAATASDLAVPVVQATVTPTWVGPLDVVVVSGDDSGDPRLAESIAAAVGRGADVVVDAPDEGPVGAASAGRAVLLPPRLVLPARHAFARHLAVYVALFASIVATRVRAVVPDLDDLADAVDTESARNHPDHEVFHNPAKALATRVADRRIVVAGDRAHAAALADHAAGALVVGAGIVAASATLSDVLGARALLADTGSASGAAYDPIFHDEEIDGPRPMPAVRVLVVSADLDVRRVEQRVAALSDAHLVTVDAGELDGAPPSGAPVDGAVPGSVLTRSAVLAARFETAAAYLRLAGGR